MRTLIITLFLSLVLLISCSQDKPMSIGNPVNVDPTIPTICPVTHAKDNCGMCH